MFDYENFKSKIFSIQPENFQTYALEVFVYQYLHNPTYQIYCQHLGKSPDNVHSLQDIPFLPIEFFKTHQVMTGKWKSEKVFMSSGTTGMQRSEHHVRDLGFYHKIAQVTFERLYGSLQSIEVMALLPSYLEQGDSSLISMVDHFMSQAHPASAYYLGDHTSLQKAITSSDRKKLLIGVSYALLDMADALSLSADNLIVMETGGMKGRRKEMIRTELHEVLMKNFAVEHIHSEYGMTELTSQAYAMGGQFAFPPWARALVRDINDPFSFLPVGRTGGLNIVDLANINSCAFVETKDLGLESKTGHFEVLGRFDNSDVRGCNLLV
jgi:hypothetical protein